MKNHSPPTTARKHSGRYAAHWCRHAALALALGLSGQFAQAAGTFKATDGAPRADEIEWIDLSDYTYADVRQPDGQNFSITLQDGLGLTFQLKHTNAQPDLETWYGVVPAPITFRATANNPSFGRTSAGGPGYAGIGGKPIIFGNRWGTVEITNIQLSDASGHRYNFEWIAADAESTARSNDTPSLPARQEYTEFESNGSLWTIVANLPRAADGAPNPGTLTINSSLNLAHVEVRLDSPPAESGAYVLGTHNPKRITYRYGSDTPGDGDVFRSRQAAAFGIVPGARIDAPPTPAPTPVPTNNPLSLVSIALALGWLARRKLRAA